MNKRTIYLADDHNIVAQGIAALLSQIDAVGDIHLFRNGQELFHACAAKVPDVVFLDLEMPVWDGRKTLVEVKKNYATVSCFILSMLNEKYIVEDCMDKGAAGYLHKDCTLQELSEAIHLPKGEVCYSKEVLKVLSGVKKTAAGHVLTEPLSDREKEILHWLCEGLSPREIGDKLFLSPRTVETHKTNIMQKFNVNSVGKLISTALKNKLV
ncbi:DNA-binding response regulator, NarL/FixJ family, contains REC and HTH domains [Catalinimonas alkaloidigena]|uniref:DNA-binding response regulator, NarL/FixJ family, contains REC and HTH domains n=1 Tax=Catalinimonas alkaloidigena TaxID=1075417 RepID=A0A1G9VTX6_9BACT|nr:response regulator transcription factor [Catalinimonas alkaloidigena]SDM75684.1 DNA-binding response regulator, NarL/FixJ family, contains REC and HTH domains [Catalinimonas alkaloidigena]